MNINKIAAVLKKWPEIIVYRVDERQYIGQGIVIYDISDLPRLATNEQVCAVLGISSDNARKYNIRFADELPIAITDQEYITSVDPMPVEIKRPHGETYEAFKSEDSLIFIQQLFLKPLENDEPYIYFAYELSDGSRLLVVEYGMLGPIMYVMEYRIKADNDLLRSLRDIVRLAKA